VPEAQTPVLHKGPDVFLIDGPALSSFQTGDMALLQGGLPEEVLPHYLRAHVFGFLPCMLVSFARLRN
jgi:hypothetical protein